MRPQQSAALGVQPSGADVQAQRRYVTQGTVTYLSITFNGENQQLQLGDSVELQQMFHTQPYLELDEHDDYSFDATKTNFADWERVTLYRNDVLVWGTPP